jgi:hypothetical protein
MFDGTKKRPARRGVPIHAYVGANGSGKSLAMVHDTLPSLASGRKVVSNMRITTPDGEDHPLWEPLRSWTQLLNVEHCDVLLDEAQGVVNSRDSQAMPVQMLTKLCMLRKDDVVLRMTAPAFTRLDKVVREVCQAVTVCRGYMPQPNRSIDKEVRVCDECRFLALAADARVELEGEDLGDDVIGTLCERHANRLWAVKRLFWWRTYDAMEWEEFSLQKIEAVKPLATSWYWRPGRPAESHYDTLARVEPMDHLSDAGLCGICGGKRRHSPCSCADQEGAGGRRAEPRQRRAPEAAPTIPVEQPENA